MPYVADVYQLPPGSNGTPNTTIESSKYNTFLADITTAQNTARPVLGGGTGGQTAASGNDGLNTKGADIASGSTTNLAAATGVYLNITGTTTINSFGTVAAGAERVLTFTGILTLTYNATSMILPGAANITTAVGDTATFRSLGAGNWRCVDYLRANGSTPGNAISNSTISTSTILLKQSAAPTPTAEGDIQWDTDDNIILVGDGATAQSFVPFPASVVAGDLFYAASAKALTRLPKGTAAQALVMNAGATAPSWVSVPFTKSFESAQQSITTSGGSSVAHGLGAQPKLYLPYLVCVTAQGGYSINDEVMPATNNPDTGSSGRNVTLVPDGTNITYRYGNIGSSGANDGVFIIVNKTTGAVLQITNANWKLVIRAWA